MTSTPAAAVDGDGTAAPDPGWWDRRSVVFQAAVAAFVVAAVFLVVAYGLAQIYGEFRWWPWASDESPAMYDLTRNAATITALIGGAVAIAVSLRRQRSTERTVELGEGTARTAQETARITAQAYELDQSRAQREEVDRFRDRYTAIAGQLGDDAAPVRLAGVYAMAALADDWLRRAARDGESEAQVCIDVLCAYIRTPRYENTDEGRQADVRVRETITRVIAQHLRPAASGPSWSSKAFDFTGAVLTGTHRFDGVSFDDGVRFTFDEVTFSEDSRLSFIKAKFTEGCRVTFRGTSFSDGGSVFFNGAEFDYGCWVTFSSAKFTKGCRITFSSAKFTKGCAINFEGARFNEGCRIFFTEGRFNQGCRISFNRARFNEGCQFIFYRARFNKGCRVAFNEGRFTEGCHITFIEARFNEGWPVGPWGDQPPPEVWTDGEALSAQ